MEKIYKIIVSSMLETSDLSGNDLNNDTPIFGGESNIDSLGLVTLLVNIEQKIEDEMNVNITIADAAAMSQKNSPFRTLDSLSSYLETLL